jgi:hypothetical protein
MCPDSELDQKKLDPTATAATPPCSENQVTVGSCK